jgi:F0F1-type ATP synthase assembly protein I
MEITACPKCGSRKIFQGRLKEGVLTGYTPTKYVCSECGYQGNPIIFDSIEEYKKFLKEFKSDSKEKNSDEKTDSLSKKDKEVIKYLRDTEKELKFEKHPTILKNSFVWIGIVVLVVGIWISSRGGFSPLFGISLFFVGIILLLVGFFTPREEISITKSSKPTFGGIFLMMAGVLGIFTWIDFFSLIDESINDPLFISQFGLDASYEILESIFLICGTTGIIFSILAILGGILAVKRKYCIVSIVCGFFGILVIGPLFSSTILSLLGIIFIYCSKKCFNK